MRDWKAHLESAQQRSDVDERQARIDRISADPRAEWAPPVPKNYPTTEWHNLICADAENANLSMPEAGDKYGQPHHVGGILLSDHKETPLGWIKLPKSGTSIDTIKDEYPELYEYMKNVKKADKF